MPPQNASSAHLYPMHRAHYTLAVSGLRGFSMTTSKAGLMPRSRLPAHQPVRRSVVLSDPV